MSGNGMKLIKLVFFYSLCSLSLLSKHFLIRWLTFFLSQLCQNDTSRCSLLEIKLNSTIKSIVNFLFAYQLKL